MNDKNKKPSLLRYKLAALIGTIIMAVGAFMACLCVTPAYITVGNVLLIVSIVIMVYGYSVWQPYQNTPRDLSGPGASVRFFIRPCWRPCSCRACTC